ncbi:MAG TPA: MoaD/ThiS family protein [Pirellulales bacterium]|jgi:hypothetical protein
MIRVALPYHLRMLAHVSGEVQIELSGAATIGTATIRTVTIGDLLDALEAKYPMLRGTIRDHVTLKRRPFVRFFACQQDVSLEATDFVLPEAIATGTEPFLVVGAIAGG